MAKNWWKIEPPTHRVMQKSNLAWNYKFNFLPNPSGPYYMGNWTINASFMYD
jgi:hypothetical protein